jgi:chromosome segregation ATPase
VGAIVAATVGYIWYLDNKIEVLEEEVVQLDNDIVQLQASKIVKETELDMCIATVKQMNTTVENMQVDMNASLDKYNKLKSEKPEVRYEVIYKYIGKGASNECEDIKSSINAIRGIDYDSL